MSRNSSNRCPMPCFAGMPARILSSRMRRHSPSANLPSRKNASREAVSTQLGFPRPALSIVAALCRDASFESCIRWSFSSKGDSCDDSDFCVAREVFSFDASAIEISGRSEIEGQAAVDDPLVLRVVLFYGGRPAEGELDALREPLDDERIDVDEPLVGHVVVVDRVLRPQLQRPAVREPYGERRIEVPPAYLPGVVLGLVIAVEVADHRVEGDLALGPGENS